MSRAIVVGGGILGTMHAAEALLRGWEVVHLDIDPEPAAATVRNPGMVWVSGRAPGLELDLSLRSRRMWDDVAARAPGVGLRAEGSITVATEPAHLEVFDQVLSRPDAARRRLRFLDRDDVRRVNPALQGELLGGLHCPLDAVVEPRLTLPALREQLLAGGDYTFLGGRQVWEVDAGRVVDTNGRTHAGDLVVVCPGATGSVLTSMVTARAPLQRVRLQIMQTARFPVRLRTMVAGGDVLRRQPSYDVPARAALSSPEPVVEEFDLELVCSQRGSGALTIGDTREYEEPFGFDLSERPYRYMAERLEALLGRPLPAVSRRWAGIYHRCTDDRLWYREMVDQDVVVVTAAGSRGMTLAPLIARDTFSWIEEGDQTGGSLTPSGRGELNR